MLTYCKAYKIEDLRKFSGWSQLTGEKDGELKEDDILYIKEDLTVTKNCLDLDSTEDLVVTEITPEWETYCKDSLAFAVPDWEAESAAVREALKNQEENQSETND